MIARGHDLSVVRQCQLLALPRSTLYYHPRPMPPCDLELMRRIDELHLAYPWMGSRSLQDQLLRVGWPVSRGRVRRLMRVMGINAVYRRPRTSLPAPGHTIYPYLLRNLTIDRPNQVWAADITYLPMARGFLYLVAIMDWYSRKVLAWRLSNTLTADFCVAALEHAVARYGAPEIFNTDQGCQFTGVAFTGTLKAAGVAISMDGKGRWRDNVFIERLWRSVKYEEVYLHAYDGAAEARAGVGAYFTFYNVQRTHQALGRRTPDEAYYQSEWLREAA